MSDTYTAVENPLDKTTPNVKVKTPHIWFIITLVLIGFIFFIGSSYELKITELAALSTLTVIVSGLWYNANVFYYTHTHNLTKLAFDQKVYLERKAIDDNLAVAKALSAKESTEQRNSFNIIVQEGFSSNSRFLEERIKANTEILQQRLEYDKKQMAVNTISHWYMHLSEKATVSRNFLNDKFFPSKLVGNGSQLNVADAVNKDPQLYSAVKSILDYFEKISLSVEKNIADNDILKEYFEDIFKTYYDCYYDFIKNRQHGAEGTRNAYVHFCRVSVKWGAVPK